jgi:hypothetical protein
LTPCVTYKALSEVRGEYYGGSNSRPCSGANEHRHDAHPACGFEVYLGCTFVLFLFCFLGLLLVPNIPGNSLRSHEECELRPFVVDGNQLCDLGRATQIVLFYRCLAVTARSKQRLDLRGLTDSVNAYCQAISHRVAIDFRALIGPLSDLTLPLQRHFSTSTKFAHVESRFCGGKQRGKAAYCTSTNPCARRACSRSVAVGLFVRKSSGPFRTIGCHEPGAPAGERASIMASATPFFFCTTQKHLTVKSV